MCHGACVEVRGQRGEWTIAYSPVSAKGRQALSS